MITSMAGADPLPISSEHIERRFAKHVGHLGPDGLNDFDKYETVLERLDRSWRGDFREKVATAKKKAEQEAKSKRGKGKAI